MNAILSLILSFVLAFGGAGMPAVPETATTYTLGDIVLTVQDETIALNPALVLTTAAGSEQVQAQFGVELGEDTLMPVAGELTADGVKFSLGSGRAYSLSAETLNALTGMSEPHESSMAPLQEFGEFAVMIPELYRESFSNYEANFALSEEMYAHWTELSGATPETFEIDVNGVSVPVTCVELNLTAQDMLSSLDLLREKGSPVIQAYLQKMLDLYSMLSGVEASNFSEFFNVVITTAPDEAGAAEALEFAIPMELTYGSKDGLYYMEELVDTEIDGVAMDVAAVSVYQDGVNEMSMSMTMGDEKLTMNMGGTFIFDLAGNMSVNFEILGSGSEDAPLDLDIFISMNTTVGEDGLRTTNSGMDFLVSAEEINTESGYTAATEVNISFGWNSEERFEEDGSITADCEFNLYIVDGEEVIPVSLAFSLNRAEAAFADAFEGMELVQLPADTENEAYQMLGSELIGLAADLMTLSMEESVAELIALFEAQPGVLTVTEVAAPADEYAGMDDPAVLDEDYLLDDIYYEEALDYPEYSFSAYDGGEVDFAAATEVYGSELAFPAAPEGYELSWMYASPEYCSMDFTSDAAYISLSCSPVYDYISHTMVVGEDGSLTALDTPTAQVQLNEDGSMLYIDIICNGTIYSLYVDGVPAEDVQAMIAAIMG